ncbi:MAG: glycoside hydrolase family 32 protein [Bryobacterales bacterium]|nr:glycoside hydrolase family 32 protein [Bryobacterales bacterium]
MTKLAILLLCGALLPAQDAFRPVYHFRPAQNWMNDPNGLIQWQGQYHLFYQYNPFGDVWGHMSWGHAVSRDLVHWRELPVAMQEENGVMIFSGSTVVDSANTSGFCRGKDPCLVAIYTGHTPTRQHQNLAYSRYDGLTWTKYSGNPVIDLGMKDFRDPKVFWHPDQRRWIMVVALPREHKVRFFASSDLKQWKPIGDFGPAGATSGVWECPDLFPLTIQGEGKQRWVLVVSINPGGPAGGSAVQYFIGDFDAMGFHAHDVGAPVLWADYGKDFYAATSFSGIPVKDGRRIWIGWFSNWQYARDEPSAGWRTIQSVPRQLSLRRTSEGLRLVQRPISDVEAGPRNEFSIGGVTLAEANQRLSAFSSASFGVEAELSPGTGLLVRKGRNEETKIGIDAAGRPFVDRTRSGNVAFHKAFSGVHTAPINARGKLYVLVDRSSVEVFAAGGEAVISDRIFPSPTSLGLALYGDSTRRNHSVRVWQIQ